MIDNRLYALKIFNEDLKKKWNQDLAEWTKIIRQTSQDRDAIERGGGE